mmetsp:Transcript_8740/g.34416  ORF Transcript_8740/g.34416 Transcript_8740/m.34416 type:complete len:237 (+) Transcript_8740:1440-2150(+)
MARRTEAARRCRSPQHPPPLRQPHPPGQQLCRLQPLRRPRLREPESPASLPPPQIQERAALTAPLPGRAEDRPATQSAEGPAPGAAWRLGGPQTRGCSRASLPLPRLGWEARRQAALPRRRRKARRSRAASPAGARQSLPQEPRLPTPIQHLRLPPALSSCATNRCRCRCRCRESGRWRLWRGLRRRRAPQPFAACAGRGGATREAPARPATPPAEWTPPSPRAARARQPSPAIAA